MQQLQRYQLVNHGWKNLCTYRKVTEGLIDNEKGGFIAGRGCVDQIFTLKEIGEKEQEKKCSVCGFYGLGEGI